MTTSDPQQILDRIKARTEEHPDDSGSAAELSELLDVARDDSLRLAEALEAVLRELDKLSEENPPNCLGSLRDEARAGGIREAVVCTRAVIEAKLNEEEQG